MQRVIPDFARPVPDDRLDGAGGPHRGLIGGAPARQLPARADAAARRARPAGDRAARRRPRRGRGPNGLTAPSCAGSCGRTPPRGSTRTRGCTTSSRSPLRGRVRRTPPRSPPFPLDQTFLLHSKPGSQKTLLLDFDGATVTGTAWNTRGRAQRHLPGVDASTRTPAPSTTPSGRPSRRSGSGSPRTTRRSTSTSPPQDPGLAGIDRTNAGDPVYGTRALITPSDTAETAICGGREPVRRRGLHRRLRRGRGRFYPAGLGLPPGARQRHQEHRRGDQPRGRPQLRPQPRRPRAASATTPATTCGRRSWASATTGPSCSGARASTPTPTTPARTTSRSSRPRRRTRRTRRARRSRPRAAPWRARSRSPLRPTGTSSSSATAPAR